MSLPQPGPSWTWTTAQAQSASPSWRRRALLVRDNDLDVLISTDSKAYVLAETLLVGGRRLNQREFPQRGVAGGENFIGRRGELATVWALVRRVRTDGQALLLFGEPGAGKSMLLDAAAEMASSAGVCVLVVC